MGSDHPRSGRGIKRNLRRFANSEHCALDDLWGNREWRELAVVKRLLGEVEPSEAKRLDQSWVQAFCERVATLGYTRYGAAPPLRNEQNTPMYHLLFFSKDEAGLTIWRGITKIEASRQRRLDYGED
ncbi:MAG TPA: hypothetical protein VFO67_08105 [Gemmatimonadales bacterium]|nr:hypothetical protein [Gemmatimonadales bacterium]